MLKVRVEKPDLSLSLDLRLASQNMAMGMREFWADQLDRGLQADGTPLPDNAEGKPLGRGHGTLIRKWTVRSMARTRGVGRAWVRPYRGGKYKAATWKLAQRGVQFQNFAGASAQAFERVATEVAHDALNEALERKGKRRRGRIRQWSGRPPDPSSGLTE